MSDATTRERRQAVAAYKLAKAAAKADYVRACKAALAEARKVLGPAPKAPTTTAVYTPMSQAEHDAYLAAVSTQHVAYGLCQCLACQRASRALAR